MVFDDLQHGVDNDPVQAPDSCNMDILILYKVNLHSKNIFKLFLSLNTKI